MYAVALQTSACGEIPRTGRHVFSHISYSEGWELPSQNAAFPHSPRTKGPEGKTGREAAERRPGGHEHL